MEKALKNYSASTPNTTAKYRKNGQKSSRETIGSTPNTTASLYESEAAKTGVATSSYESEAATTGTAEAGAATKALDEQANEKKRRGRRSQKERNNSGRSNVHIPFVLDMHPNSIRALYVLMTVVKVLAYLVFGAIFFFVLGEITPLREVLPNFYILVDGILWAFNCFMGLPFKLWHFIFG